MSKRISKFLSLVLRHEPARIGITLDDAGWTDVAALLAATAAHGVTITRDELAEVVRSSDKQRFALSDDGTRIRANQGHSVDVDLQLPPATPPAILFHGTVAPALPSIRTKGLIKGERHHVHLSAELDTATKVGKRRGAPVILEVRAAAMVAAGHVFFLSNNGVWLVDTVPAEFIDFPSPPSDPVDRTSNVSRGARVGIAKSTLAACEAGEYINAGNRVPLRDAIDHARDGTLTHELGDPLRPRDGGGTTAIEVTGETTIAALRRLAGKGGHLACLNFASAKNPGGGFLGGAQAQEESLARSSGLYPCLLTQSAHYDRNRANHSALYLDLAIWSPLVPVFRDDDGTWLDRPVLASVITCAAPNAGALRQQGKLDLKTLEATLRRRADFVLAIAAHHAVERLVLGAWGAGVFANDPALVAAIFGALLANRFANVFPEVTFAVMGGPGDANYDAFAARFA
ncbi:MAG: RNA 2'-phosphotransferase [Kofleriaceae bacterium]